MAVTHFIRTSLRFTGAAGVCLAAAGAIAAAQGAAPLPLKIASGHVSIAGTSNIHAYTATSADVRVTRVQFATGVAGPDFWDAIVRPGAIEAFEIAIPAASLSSPKDGLDKNMHKALKAKEHPEITFRLIRLEAREGAGGALRAVGLLTIAGVEREVTIDLSTDRGDSTLTVKGEARLLMTDYGIAPPKAMLGMLKTDPKVTVTFETVLAVPLT